jgi:hypothetical protein
MPTTRAQKGRQPQEQIIVCIPVSQQNDFYVDLTDRCAPKNGPEEGLADRRTSSKKKHAVDVAEVAKCKDLVVDLVATESAPKLRASRNTTITTTMTTTTTTTRTRQARMKASTTSIVPEVVEAITVVPASESIPVRRGRTKRETLRAADEKPVLPKAQSGGGKPKETITESKRRAATTRSTEQQDSQAAEDARTGIVIGASPPDPMVDTHAGSENPPVRVRRAGRTSKQKIGYGSKVDEIKLPASIRTRRDAIERLPDSTTSTTAYVEVGHKAVSDSDKKNPTAQVIRTRPIRNRNDPTKISSTTKESLLSTEFNMRQPSCKSNHNIEKRREKAKNSRRHSPRDDMFQGT